MHVGVSDIINKIKACAKFGLISQALGFFSKTVKGET